MSDFPTAWLAYDWRGGRERIATVGTDGPAILFLAPFFEEANRTRHFVIETMRGLAGRGFRCFLPDMPGTLESLTQLDSLTWADWTGAARAAADMAGATHIVSLRGGALLDGALDARTRWRLAPAEGSALLRDLIRIRLAADREDGSASSAADLEAKALSEPFDVAGYRIAPGFVAALKGAALADAPTVRTVRLATDAQAADAKLAGQPLWRRSEPEHDPQLCESVIADISDWIASCDIG
jgi:pimeloyl-ACP methyl ester carboxylesterase